MCRPGISPGKSQGRGLFHSPPIAQDFQQLGGEYDVPIFLSLALFDTDDHALAVNLGGFQADDLGDPQPAA
jgi:hypothetical protein